MGLPHLPELMFGATSCRGEIAVQHGIAPGSRSGYVCEPWANLRRTLVEERSQQDKRICRSPGCTAGKIQLHEARAQFTARPLRQAEFCPTRNFGQMST